MASWHTNLQLPPD